MEKERNAWRTSICPWPKDLPVANTNLYLSKFSQIWKLFPTNKNFCFPTRDHHSSCCVLGSGLCTALGMSHRCLGDCPLSFPIKWHSFSHFTDIFMTITTVVWHRLSLQSALRANGGQISATFMVKNNRRLGTLFDSILLYGDNRYFVG